MSATTTFDGSSAEASTERVMREMCRAFSVTDVTDQDDWFTRACTFSRASAAAVWTAMERSCGITAGAVTAAGTDNSRACPKKPSRTRHAALFAFPVHRLTTSSCRTRVAATYRSRSIFFRLQVGKFGGFVRAAGGAARKARSPGHRANALASAARARGDDGRSRALRRRVPLIYGGHCGSSPAEHT